MKRYEIKLTNQFKKQLKKLQKQPNFSYKALDEVINILASNDILPTKYRNHLLEPKKNGIWECHVQPDVLLEYQKIDNLLIITLLSIGSHSNLFK